MKKIADLKRLDRLDNLIRLRATGNAVELAQKLEMSKSSLYELLAFLRDEMGAPITYSNLRQSYVYEYVPKFYFGFERDQCEADIMTDDKFVGESCLEKESVTSHQENRRVKKTIKIELEDISYILANEIDFDFN